MLQGKSAVITCSASGIGFGIAEALAVFLCSDTAAQMTGQPVSIAGGWVVL